MRCIARRSEAGWRRRSSYCDRYNLKEMDNGGQIVLYMCRIGGNAQLADELQKVGHLDSPLLVSCNCNTTSNISIELNEFHCPTLLIVFCKCAGLRWFSYQVNQTAIIWERCLDLWMLCESTASWGLPKCIHVQSKTSKFRQNLFEFLELIQRVWPHL